MTGRGVDNDFKDFTRPEYYIRHIEPLESDLAKTVEYDMDEQGVWFLPWCCYLSLTLLLDQEWLNAVNLDRKKEQMDQVTPEAFEIIMDRLEKEWFDLVCFQVDGALVYD